MAADVLPSISSYGRYVEPFLGGGAVFFNYRPNVAVLSDINEALIELYIVMRDAPGELYRTMKDHATKHGDEYYYEMRSQEPTDAVSRAARTLYLNRTCWNGLYRVNLSGRFNVPRGTKNSVLFENEDFYAFSATLQVADIKAADFEAVIDGTDSNDLLFLDPPYTVKHNVNGFIKYNESLFKWEDQVRLRDAVVRARDRNVAIIMTNADHNSVRALYDGVLRYRRINRKSVLAGSVAARVGTSEALFLGGVCSPNPSPSKGLEIQRRPG